VREIKTPRTTNESRGVKRAEMTELQKLAIVAGLDEPYSTLVLLVTRIPVRIEEAIGVKGPDLDGHVLTLRRVVYEGKAYDLQPSEQRKIPIMDIELLARLRKLGTGREWVFQSRNGTPINPCNARRRFLKPAAKELAIKLCGWHDFRHSLTTELRRNGTHPKVISDLLGHKKVNLAMDVYDRSNLQDFE
jgi:integrase